MFKKLLSLPYFKEVWSVVALSSVAIACYVSHAPALVAVGSVTGILYVLGVAFGSRWANLHGALLGAIFGYLSYSQGFFGNAAVNLLYSVPISLYGLWLWSKNSENGSLTVKRSLTRSQGTIAIAATLVAFAISCSFSFYTGSNLWYLDGLSAILPILGTWFLVNMYREQWYYWLSYNLLEVVMWFTVLSTAPEMLAIFVMRVTFFLNSVIGYFNWKE